VCARAARRLLGGKRRRRVMRVCPVALPSASFRSKNVAEKRCY
jgi:hypothetical protein